MAMCTPNCCLVKKKRKKEGEKKEQRNFCISGCVCILNTFTSSLDFSSIPHSIS